MSDNQRLRSQIEEKRAKLADLRQRRLDKQKETAQRKVSEVRRIWS